MKKNTKKALAITAGVVGATYVVMRAIAKKQNQSDIYKNDPTEQNPMYKKQVIFVEDENDPMNADGKCGHLEAVGEITHIPTFYEKYVKRGLDIALSFGGMIVLAPVYAGTAIAINLDDPGEVIFKQKRIKAENSFFTLIKFRSMRKASDIPTHMLSDGGQSNITRVGRVIRKLSIDELPQMWSIFKGDMSIIGPRPALWNQDWLTAERSKYGANDIKPGLTGLAQISGRDALEIPDKARFDGEYTKALKKSSWSGFMMDCKVFFGTIKAVLCRDGVVEGGTGELSKENGNDFSDYGFLKHFDIDKTRKIKVLITGANSYIGMSFEEWAKEHYPNIEVDTVDTIDGTWREKDFSSYDAVFHVAGLAHADVGHVDEATKQKYYAVNTDLAIEVAEKAKADGVKQFVFMSSMIVYGESAGYGKTKCVDEHTIPSPANFYGDSKWQADKGVRALATEDFNVAVLRPPMIYGRGSKGNYPTLSKLAKKLPVFPNVNNERSMLHIDNLCEFLCLLMLSGENGVYFPQNAEYTKTADMVKTISHVCEKNIFETKLLNPAVAVGSHVPGKIGGLVNKAFGNMTYDQKLSQYDGLKYEINDLKESITKTESGSEVEVVLPSVDSHKYSVLMSVYYKERPEYLKASIESMLSQTLLPEQFVIVEDGPLGNELEKIIVDYESKYPEMFTIVRLPENGGLGNALNQGMKVCRNELVARMDSDDISLPERCAKEVECLISDSGLSIVGSQINEFIETTDNVVSSRIVPTDNAAIKEFARRRSPFNHPTVMYRKSVIDTLDGYQTSGRKEDLDLFIRLVNSGYKAMNLDEALLMYRTSNDNLQRRKTWQNCSEYISIMYGFYKKGYCGLSDLLYVIAGQTAMYVTPNGVTDLLNKMFLRQKGRGKQ